MNWPVKKEEDVTIGQTRERSIFCWLPHYGTDGRTHWLEKTTIQERFVSRHYGGRLAGTGLAYCVWEEVGKPYRKINPPPPPTPPEVR